MKNIFLDEISGIQNWQKTVKILVDSGEIGDACLFLTGSHTLDIKKDLICSRAEQDITERFSAATSHV